MERNRTCVQSFRRPEKNMRGSTLERDRITAQHVGKVTLNHLLYTNIQNTFTESRSSLDSALSSQTPHPHQT